MILLHPSLRSYVTSPVLSEARTMMKYLAAIFNPRTENAGRASLLHAFLTLDASSWRSLHPNAKIAVWQEAIQLAVRAPVPLIMPALYGFIGDHAAEVLDLLLTQAGDTHTPQQILTAQRCMRHLQAPFFTQDVRARGQKAANHLAAMLAKSKKEESEDKLELFFTPLPDQTFAQHLFAHRAYTEALRRRVAAPLKRSPWGLPSPLSLTASTSGGPHCS
jgi:hypothetical protein